MKMINKKGFTLIELIATITVLGIIMLVAVPNITSMIDKSKRSAYINDAKKLVTLAKYKFETSSNPKPDPTNCYIYTLNALDQTELNDPPNGGSYVMEYSYVKIGYDYYAKKYTYKVQLVEKYKAGNDEYCQGVKQTEYKDLGKDNAKIMYVSDSTKFDQVRNNFSAYYSYMTECHNNVNK